MDNKKYIALSFDDGPNTETTVRVLDVLEKNHAVASFFVNGQNIDERSGDVMRRAAAIGCEVENHSQHHYNMTELNPAEMMNEINMTSELVEKYTGRAPQFFRPPFIRINELMFDTIPLTFIAGLGTNDWSADVTEQQSTAILMSDTIPGDILLLHDKFDNPKTDITVAKIIPYLRSKGFEFVTVSQLFPLCGIAPNHKLIYHNAFQTDRFSRQV